MLAALSDRFKANRIPVIGPKTEDLVSGEDSYLTLNLWCWACM